MTIKALVFDFDGLILDTEEPIFRAWQEVYLSYGFQLSLETWSITIGTADFNFLPMQDLEKLVGHELDRQQINARQQKRESELILAQPVLPGVQDYLITARRLGLKVGLASSSSHRWVTGHLSRLGLLQYFETIKTSNDVQHTKPDPELYLAVLREWDISAHEAIALEDSPHGIRSAKLAGMYCVVVPNVLTAGLPTDHADLRLDSLACMPLEALIVEIERPRS